jgi:hypothetical protein
MSILRPLRKTSWVLLGCGLALVIQSAARADEATVITAVSSRVSDDYVRARLQNGFFAPETYAFGKGGYWGGPMHDGTIDELRFIDVARTIAGPLAAQNYLPTKDPNETKLLIMVYWGTTTGSLFYRTHSGSIDDYGGETLDKLDALTAPLLGYETELAEAQRLRLTPFRFRLLDLIDEIEQNRYFVVLMAYDFQLLWKQKKHKLLWETRFSIPEQRSDFSLQLVAMARYASRYFGQDTKGLIRKPLPEGNVKVGELKVLGIEPEKK